LLQFLARLGWEHINLTGDYVWRQSRRLEDGKFRPLRMPGKPERTIFSEVCGLPLFTALSRSISFALI
ncbi:hypothetical protein, partial [Klebsiella pneumoniae]|uniref:hypothetical protein n=1 Tax=Klebsiella pneumoniae TaxID=573 RepID=UPI003D800F1A